MGFRDGQTGIFHICIMFEIYFEKHYYIRTYLEKCKGVFYYSSPCKIYVYLEVLLITTKKKYQTG